MSTSVIVNYFLISWKESKSRVDGLSSSDVADIHSKCDPSTLRVLLTASIEYFM